MGNPLFARKSMSMLLSEALEEGGHSLKRTLGPVQLTALGWGRSSERVSLCFRDLVRTMPGRA